MSAHELLRAMVDPLVDVSDETLRALARQLRPVSYRAGERIYDFQVVCRDVVVMEEGIARAYYVHDTTQVNLRLVGAPAVATAMASLVTGQPSEERLEAVTPVRGYRGNLSGIDGPKDSVLFERLRRVLAEQHYLSLERRLRMLQHKTVAERYEYFCRVMDPSIVRDTPGYHIASYLGVAPETLSRVRRRRG